MGHTPIKLALFSGLLAGVGCQTPTGFRDISVTRATDKTASLSDGASLTLSDHPTNSRWAAKPQDKAARASLSDVATDDVKPLSKPLALKTPADRAENTKDSKEILGAFQGSDPKIRDLAERQLAAALSLPKQPTPDPSTPTKIDSLKESVASPIQRVSHTEPAREVASDNESGDLPRSEKKILVDESMSVDELVTQLLKRLEADSTDTKSPSLRKTMTHATLLALQGRADEAASVFKGLDTIETEYLQQQFQALATIADEQGPPSRGKRYALALPELREAISHLGAATGALAISTPVFCSEVESFGSVTRFKHDRFTAGQQVILYCEVDHFVAEKVSKGFETQLQGGYELFNDEGVKVSEQTLPEDKQVCDHYRRDYFIAYRMYLPNNLEPGSYRLRLTMEDHKGKLYGQSETKFEITKSSATKDKH